MSDSIAIAVLHYNKTRLTSRCLDSLMAADMDPERIFCLDNGSEQAFSGDIADRYPMFYHKKLDRNIGFSGGFNAAMRTVFSAGYDQCLFLTNDTVFHKGADETISAALSKHDAGMAAPCIRYLSKPDRIDSLGAFFNPDTATLGHYHDSDLPVLLQPGHDYIPGTALAMTKSAFETLGGADESFHTYWEDVDLSFRAAEAGVPMIRCPDARIEHGVGQTCHKKPFYTTFLFQRNRLKFCRCHLSGDALLLAEKTIRSDWLAMRALREEKGDVRRLKYLDELFTLADQQ